MVGALLIALTLGVAYANGANDVSKGVATLVGSGVTDYRRAVLWGTVWTVLGGMAAALASRGLVATFSGNGLLATDPAGHAFLLAVGVGAIGWISISTRSGMPVSTTHALVGGLVGAGIAAQGVAGVQWTAVATTTAVPLAVSPLVALALMVASYPLVVARMNAMDSMHWLTAGGTSFFRGMNDTPKILALGVLAAGVTGVSVEWLFMLVALAMGAGSYIAGRRVTETLAGKVTTIKHDDGFAANLVTSALVGIASFFAFPVSTTHVSTGAIMGVGARKRDVRWRMVRDMVAAWVVTLPAAGIIAGLAYAAVSRLE